MQAIAAVGFATSWDPAAAPNAAIAQLTLLPKTDLFVVRSRFVAIV